jgi:myo-inositol-1(or 4)-monophosphatase
VLHELSDITVGAGLRDRAQLAITLARDAAQHLSGVFAAGQPIASREKSDGSLVTNIDHDIERMARARITASFPEDGVFGEELGVSGTTAQQRRLWIVDPLDGTRNFLSGIPAFCFSLAFLSDGVPRLAIVCDPIHNEVFYAQHGEGAFLNCQRLRLSKSRGTTRLFGWSHSPGTPFRHYIDGLALIDERGFVPWDNGSASLMLSYVAAGRLSGCAEIALPAWDVVPGLLIAGEAGCCVGPEFPAPNLPVSPMFAGREHTETLARDLLRLAGQHSDGAR